MSAFGFQADASHAPVHLSASEAEAWAAGYNTALDRLTENPMPVTMDDAPIYWRAFEAYAWADGFNSAIEKYGNGK